ncbi:unnamed protein product [Ilex paraguariensis]|uniref:RIN4 pathogenic type III effector avirulence factor Avr cleavage site domain-containing protein n=1 Tax=Ilex paraguariensis TaxID=185542 RepID=A0ABC8TFM0_9AQUA
MGVQRPNVPQFGNWENEGAVPYTIYFDNARKGKKGGKMINPNDPQENRDLFANIPPLDQAPPSRIGTDPGEPTGRRAVRPTHERPVSSREDGNLRQFTDSPARNANLGNRHSSESVHQYNGGRGSNSGRPVRQSAGSEHSIDRSTDHPHHQAKLMGKGSGSPASEGKNSYDSSHGTPGRSRLKPVTRRDESVDKAAAIPRFGDWDVNNPSSADNYTDIFNRKRQEKQAEGGNSTSTVTDPSYNHMKKQSTNGNQKVCGFLLLSIKWLRMLLSMVLNEDHPRMRNWFLTYLGLGVAQGNAFRGAFRDASDGSKFPLPTFSLANRSFAIYRV